MDNSEKPIYTAAFNGASNIPDEVATWALEMVGRRPCREDIVEKIAEHHRQQAEQDAERMRSDPIYRERHEQKERLAVPFLPSRRALPPWPLGPRGRVEKDFRECCTQTVALTQLMRVRAEQAAELLLASLIESSPVEVYGGGPRLEEELGLEFDQEGYPTAYWKSPFLSVPSTSTRDCANHAHHTWRVLHRPMA